MERITSCKNDHYVAETGRKMLERALENTGRDPNSHLFKHSVEISNRNYLNKSRVNDKRWFIDNPYLSLATRFVYNYRHYQAIFVTIFSLKNSFIKLN